MSETHNADEVCPIIEKHKRNETAKVWFSGAVVRALKTYDERASLVGALGDELIKFHQIIFHTSYSILGK